MTQEKLAEGNLYPASRQDCGLWPRACPLIKLTLLGDGCSLCSGGSMATGAR